jgi:chromosome transmission fidelity protein 1
MKTYEFDGRQFNITHYFSLIRCVVVLGLPYPNRASLELQEKLKFVEARHPGSSREHYENMCMVGVNQSIG